MRNKQLFLLLALVIAFDGTVAQKNRLESETDAFLSKEFTTKDPGIVVLIAKGDSVLYHKAYGRANLELDLPMQPDMVFKLASVTKQFTAVAVLQLVEQGKLSLQDSLQKFIPDFPAKGKTITIEHLLTHTSGIRDYMQIDFKTPFLERWDLEPKRIIDSFSKHNLEFEPGTKFNYSNSGYFLLGYIIEKISGKSYESYIQDHLLTPLSMHNSYFDDDNNIIPRRVAGYRQENGKWKNADFWSPTLAYAAGSLLSNAADLHRWIRGLVSYKILSKQSLEKAFTQTRLKDGSSISYGYGWYVLNQGNLSSVEHAGRMNGFCSFLLFYPGQDISIVALFNSQDVPKEAITARLSEIALGRSLQQENWKPDENSLNAYIGTYSLTIDPARTIVVTRESGKLLAKVSGQASFELVFQDAGKFQLKGIKDVSGEFVSENNRVTKMMIYQNGRFEWKKIK